MTLARRRTRGFREAKTVGDRIRGKHGYPAVVEPLAVDRETFRRSIDAFERYQDHSLSFSDAATVALVQHHDIEAVLSFDDDFDGVIDRIDPASIS